MKKRMGFVSNSSSSSFIVNFGTKPKTRDELSKIMGECKPKHSPDITNENVIDFVWDEIKDIKHAEMDNPNIINIIEANGMDVYDDWEIYELLVSRSLINDIQDRKYDETKDCTMTYDELKKRIMDNLDKVFNLKSNDFIKKIEISDDTSYWSQMEHGNIFRNCKDVKVKSNH